MLSVLVSVSVDSPVGTPPIGHAPFSSLNSCLRHASTPRLMQCHALLNVSSLLLSPRRAAKRRSRAVSKAKQSSEAKAFVVAIHDPHTYLFFSSFVARARGTTTASTDYCPPIREHEHEDTFRARAPPAAPVPCPVASSIPIPFERDGLCMH